MPRETCDAFMHLYRGIHVVRERECERERERDRESVCARFCLPPDPACIVHRRPAIPKVGS
jgi:hypothetical protein